MTPMTDPATLLAHASDHLQHAATLAEPRDPGLAGQIRLAAATLPADPQARTSLDEPADDSGDVDAHLTMALDCLDQIAPLDGPTDLQLCAWHVHELRRIATTGAPFTNTAS